MKAYQPTKSPGGPSPVPPIVHEVLHSPGQALDAATRAIMEPRFRHDFSHVRVHTDARAAASAAAVNALAYTVGADVVFGKGHDSLRTETGRRLLAHELTHVVQQAGVNGRPALISEVSRPSDAVEREAMRVATDLVSKPSLMGIASPGREAAYTPLRAPAAVRLFRTAQPWPVNGYVINDSSKPVTVWNDLRGLYTIAAGSTSGRFTEDVDHIKDEKGQWYKIGANTVTVDASGAVHGYKCAVNNFGEDCPTLEKQARSLAPPVSTWVAPGVDPMKSALLTRPVKSAGKSPVTPASEESGMLEKPARSLAPPVSTWVAPGVDPMKTKAVKSAGKSALEKPVRSLAPPVHTGVAPRVKPLNLPAGAKPKRGIGNSPVAPSSFKGPLSESVPQTTVLSIFAEATIPAGKVFKDDLYAKAYTRAPTRVTVRLSASGLEIGFSPGIFIDATLVSNMELVYIGYDFKKAEADAQVLSVGLDLFAPTSYAESNVVEMITPLVAGTPAAAKGYDPMADEDPMATLDGILVNLENQPSESGTSSWGASDVTRLGIGAALKTKAPIEFDSDGSGIQIPAGSPIEIRVSSGAGLSQLLAAKTKAETSKQANIQSVTVSSDSIVLLNKGKPVAKLNRARLERGGKVTVEALTLLGVAETADSAEWLISALGNALDARVQGASPWMSVLLGLGKAKTKIVPGLTQGLIEDALTRAITKAVLDNANAIPGVDLAQALGIKK